MANAALSLGVFDSGVGGLSVLREIRHHLPKASLIYVADTAYAPYGERSSLEIIERSLKITDFLVKRGVDAIVIACNTASVHAAKTIRSRYALPVIAIEPAIKPAALASQSKVIAVLATTQTIYSDNVAQLTASYGKEVKILLQPCPGLVEHIENGDLRSPELRSKLSDYLCPLLEQGADTLVLGCTHYPFLESMLVELAGPQVRIIDPAPAVVRELLRRLQLIKRLPPQETANLDDLQTGEDLFLSSAATPSLEETMAKLLKRKIELRSLEI
jgi:glutamate racemase